MLAPRGVVAFDLDGTLLRGPTVCELIAAPLGQLRQMWQFESAHSKPALRTARLEMARWYRGHARAVLYDGLREATWAPGAHAAVSTLQRADIEVVIASVTWRFAVAWFARTLHVRHFVGTNLTRTGDVEHVWPATKGAWLRALVRALGVSRSYVAAVGDSAGDRHLLRAASLRFFVGREDPGIPRVTHLPNADLRDIAGIILRRWA